MTKIVTCPQCAAQLALPAEVDNASSLACPECKLEFSLGETVELDLPSAILLPATTLPTSELETLVLPPRGIDPVDDSDDPPAPPLSSGRLGEKYYPRELPADAPLSSWEVRLKKAVQDAAPPDDSEQSDVKLVDSETDWSNAGQELAPSTVTTVPDPTEFEPLEEQMSAATPTEQSTTPERLLTDSSILRFLDQSDVDSLQLDPSHVMHSHHRRQPRKRSWMRVALFLLFGSLLPTLAGFYALLWLQGPKVDYLGLGQILPQAILPTGFDPTEKQAPVEPEDLAEPPALMSESVLADGIQEFAGNQSPSAEPEAVALEAPLHVDKQVHLTSAKGIEERPASVDPAELERFRELVAEAEVAVPQLLAGDLSDPTAIKAKGPAYITLCRLAEHFELVTHKGLSPADHTQMLLAKEVFRRTVAHGKESFPVELAQIATRWWNFPQRSSAGFYFIGRIKQREPLGEQTLMEIKIESTTQPLVVHAVGESGKLQVGDPIAVVGKIVSGRDVLPSGHSLADAQVVSVGYTFDPRDSHVPGSLRISTGSGSGGF